MDCTTSMPTDESLTDPVVFADVFEEYVAKPDIQKVYDTMKKCADLVKIANDAVKFLLKDDVKNAIIKHCPAFLNVTKAAGLASALGPASITLGIGTDI